jgi:ABC-2 type transport system ATP-binding protein
LSEKNPSAPSRPPPPAIRIAALTKRYGSLQALDGIDLEIGQGEFFGLLGPNGAGKTTLISALAGLIRADSGKLEIMGHDVLADYRAARRKLGVVPQELVFDPFFTVREMLRFQSGYFGIRDNGGWIDEILHRLGIEAKAEANMRTLSGGMKRRALVAQALVHRPPVIVLDEPTAGVDVELRQSLWRFVEELNTVGHTIVLTTHYLEEAEALCGRIAMMKAGRIVALDTTANLLSRAAARRLKVRAGRPEAALALGGAIAGDWIEFGFEAPREIETLLARLREAGADVLEIAIGEPVLEQVFVELMQGA